MAASVNDKLAGALVLVDATAGRYAMEVSGLGAGDQGVPIETSPPVASRTTSTFVAGKQAAPGAGTVIATLTVPAQGTYEINVNTFIGGTTVAATEIDNMELFINGVSVGKIVNAVPGTAGATDVARTRFKYDGNSTIIVKANAAATAGSVYAANIIASRIN